MLPKPLLTKTQVLLLNLLEQNQALRRSFYFTGGTALTTFYIPYRYSEDLDFFSEKEFQIDSIVAFLKSIKDKLKYQSLDLNSSFNRNLIFLKFKKETLKTEFTYFPFPRIEKNKVGNLQVDSIIDIAANKLFTIYQNPRNRDFFDLFMIQDKYKFTTEELIKKAKIKFDWHVDPLKLGSQLLLCTKLKDYPRLVKPIPEKKWQDFFLNEAKKIGAKILT